MDTKHRAGSVDPLYGGGGAVEGGALVVQIGSGLRVGLNDVGECASDGKVQTGLVLWSCRAHQKFVNNSRRSGSQTNPRYFSSGSKRKGKTLLVHWRHRSHTLGEGPELGLVMHQSSVGSLT